MYGDGVMPAGRAWYWQVLYSVQCREPKTGQQKVQLYYEDDPIYPSSYIIYLWSIANSMKGGWCRGGGDGGEKNNVECKGQNKTV